MIKSGKRGQATIFIIIALAIILVVLAIFFYPNIKGGTNIDVSQNPQSYLENCLKNDLKNNVEELSKSGGDFNPEGYIEYNGTKIKYLCYTNEYYKTCVVQQPLIKEHMEEVLTEALNENVNTCVKNLIGEYERGGWTVSSGSITSDVNILLGNIVININAPMTLTKESSRTFKSFTLNFPSEMYNIIYISSSIVNYEAVLGDAESSLYLQYYPNINIYKNQLGDGTVIYRVENVITKEGFTFASRSVPWPPGLGLE